MYIIDERTLYKTVTRKKNAIGRRINRIEIMITVINSIVVIFLLFRMRTHPHFWGFINTGIVAATVFYIQYFRWKRKKAENRFDRSMSGELDHAISNASYIIRFNYLLFWGYLVPMSVVITTSLIVSGASLTKWLFTTGMFMLSFLVVRWEQKACNIPRKEHLLALKRKLTEK